MNDSIIFIDEYIDLDGPGTSTNDLGIDVKPAIHHGLVMPGTVIVKLETIDENVVDTGDQVAVKSEPGVALVSTGLAMPAPIAVKEEEGTEAESSIDHSSIDQSTERYNILWFSNYLCKYLYYLLI